MLFLAACAKKDLSTTNEVVPPADEAVKLMAEPGDIGYDIICTNNRNNKRSHVFIIKGTWCCMGQ